MPDEKPRLLAGENPQIEKGAGNAPVAAYLDAVPGWKQGVCKTPDALIVEIVPDVQKAVKWNTPLYSRDGVHWFTAYHCMKKYVKVTFFEGERLSPAPPVRSKQPAVRYAHIHENEDFDEALFRSWFRQASEMPGVKI